MAYNILLALVAAASTLPPALATSTREYAYHQLLARDYADEVCSPNVTTSSSTIPPCIEIQTIEEACAPNGTDPIYYAAHAQCMCTGSYFSEWTGCQDCLYFHGQRTQNEEAFYEAVASAASHSLCDFLSSTAAATPTTDFAGYFSAVEATLTHPTTGATVSSDQAPSETAVSLYFTLTGSQGPGSITGSAATATATATSGATASAGSSGSGAASGSAANTESGSASSGSGTASSGGASSTSSTGGAAPTRAAGGLLLGLGLAVAAGL